MAIKIGDRVSWKTRGEGTVACVHAHPEYLGVRFDRKHSEYHGMGGACEHGHGYYVHSKELRLVEPMNHSLPKKREW